MIIPHPAVKGTTKSGGQKHKLDKFYTKPAIAEYCLSLLDVASYERVIEPSAGSGSFSNLIPGVIAFDLDPEAAGIVSQDWFLYEGERIAGRTLVVGNPPFGQQNSLAVRFINHAASFADTIAFILPSSFMKESVQSRLDKNLHLANYWELPRNSFTLNGEDMNVPCVFQIWEYDDSTPRVVVPTPRPIGFSFVKYEEGPDLFIQRIGGNAGMFGREWEQRNSQSNYFIKVQNESVLEELLGDLGKLTHPYKDFGVGPRSISKRELLLELVAVGSLLVAS